MGFLDAPQSVAETKEDIIDKLPAEYKTESHPVLDALASSLLSMLKYYEEESDYAVSQSNILYATDQYLDSIGNALSIPRIRDELNKQYRDRILSKDVGITPTKILEIVNSILSDYTDAKAQYSECGDQLFLNNGNSNWHSFLCNRPALCSPYYPDRLYPSIGETYNRPQSEPGGAILFNGSGGRIFLLRVPQIFDSNIVRALITDGNNSTSIESSNGFFVTDSGTYGHSYASFGAKNASLLMQTIANTINKNKPQGVRWVLLSDERLA